MQYNIKNKSHQKELKIILDELVATYNQPNFIQNDPISIPHLFSKKQDIEIMGFWSAMLAWGQRKTIINKSKELINLMDNAPYDFIQNHKENDLKPFLNFKHRTFNATDTLYFIDFFRRFYAKNESLETAFSKHLSPKDETIENALIGFHNTFFDNEDDTLGVTLDVPARTRKHVGTPLRKSACKRLCMFLRWMVRKDDNQNGNQNGSSVDFGIWENISSSQLVCPCDVHVDRQARKLGLITRPQTDWKTALELTKNLKIFDPNDPVKYDFALFGLGVNF